MRLSVALAPGSCCYGEELCAPVITFNHHISAKQTRFANQMGTIHCIICILFQDSCECTRFHIKMLRRKMPKMCKSEVKLLMTSGEDISAPDIMAFLHSNDAFVETMTMHLCYLLSIFCALLHQQRLRLAIADFIQRNPNLLYPLLDCRVPKSTFLWTQVHQAPGILEKIELLLQSFELGFERIICDTVLISSTLHCTCFRMLASLI